MKHALTVVLLIALVSTFAWANERSNERPVSFDNPLMVAGPALDGTLASLDESFEGTFPPAGWMKFSPDGGTGWEQITVGTTPLPGWNGGIAYAPPAPNAGTGMAYATWTTGGAASNEQWLVTPQITGVQTGDVLSFWMYKFSDLYSDTVYIKVSTTDSAMGSFTDIATIGYAATDTGWAEYSYSLDTYDGQDIYIAFVEQVADNWNNGAAVMLDLVHVGPPLAQMVTVHFRANTAAVPDTLGEMTTLQVRGSGGPLTWDGGSGVFLHNEGSNDQWGSSDYWYGSAHFPAGDTVYYKFFTNANDTVYAGAPWEHQGWEANTNDPSGNRVLDLAGFTGTDTLLDLQFVNGWFDGIGQYDTPFTTNDSTFSVHFRVNIQGFRLQGFDPAQHKLGMRGSNTDDWGQTGELSWGTTYLLSPENNHANGGSQQYDGDNFYSGTVHVPDQYLDDGIQWKFVVHYLNSPLDDDWGNLFWNPTLEENVQFSHTSWEDTTFYWRWYDGFEPGSAAFGDTVEITFEADMSTAIANNGFTPGDTVIAISGWNLTGGDVYRTGQMVKQGFTNIYASTDTVATNIGEDFQYNYYVIKDGIEYREIFYDFTDPSGGSSAEKRKVSITGSPMTVLDDSDDPVSLRRKPNFRNLASPSQDVSVYYTCDLRPAYYQVLMGDTLVAIQGGAAFNVTDPDSVYSWGVRINGPASGGWQAWGIPLRDDTTRMMYDDGTHGDEVAGDTIFTADAFMYYAHPDSNDIIGQEFKFGVAGGDNEGGYGNNHIENIDDSTPTSYVRSQFGSIDPVFYWAWDYGTQTPNSIGDETLELPRKFALHQNFPNPFNPSTNIKFALPKQTDVKLVIYNILGQEVITLVDNNLKAGDYAKTWNGLDQHGNRVATGVYFYKLVTNEHTAVKKLIMVK